MAGGELGPFARLGAQRNEGTNTETAWLITVGTVSAILWDEEKI
jgi:hypothetical protein